MLVGHNESGFTNGTHSVADNLYVIGYLVYDSPDLPRAERSTFTVVRGSHSLCACCLGTKMPSLEGSRSRFPS